MKPNNRKLKQPSRELRKSMTDAERLLWSRLRRKQINGVQFYRQKPLGNYIVDFYGPGFGSMFLFTQNIAKNLGGPFE